MSAGEARLSQSETPVSFKSRDFTPEIIHLSQIGGKLETP